MESGVYIRAAAPSDAAGISRVICDAISTINAKDYSAKAISRLMQNFSTANVTVLMRGRTTFVAVANGHIVGTGALQQHEIKSVFVSPDFHRKGIGRRLVKTVEGAAKQQGLVALKLSSSLAAVSFCAALGYREQTRQFYGDEETVVMSKTDF
jgi:N-acetylglutamate synthase-like GNAT family acetyltransferase